MVKRIEVGARMSEAAVHAGTVHLAGQVAEDASQDIQGQTRQVLTRILMTQIFLPDLADFDGMNSVWDAWVTPGHTPPRATVQARLAKPQWKIEVVITAAV